jgi:hypothetical protein
MPTRFPNERLCALAAACVLWGAPAPAQTADLQKILERLDRLEEQNRALTAEVQTLRDELAAARATDPPAQQTPSSASAEERLDVQESRTAELAASKVGASQRFPLRLTGMVLFNSFLDSSGSGGQEYPIAAMEGGQGNGGATFRQTILGLDYDGPTVFGGGKVSGSMRMDFWSGSGSSLDQEFRLRTATIGIQWKDRSFTVGEDKPILSPRQPESLAQVGVGPLSGAGNLWVWLPQARFEQDFHFSSETGLKAQIGVVRTAEVSAGSGYSAYGEPGRPGVEGRVELFSGGEDRRIEIASGFHHSVSHVLGQPVPSDILAFDWLARPWKAIEFTGAFYSGHNVAPLESGAVRQGYVAVSPGVVVNVHGYGGWGQFTLRPLARLWFNLFSGQQDDRNSELPYEAIGKNLVYGGNVFYRLAPNVLASVEVTQARTTYLGLTTLLNNHYDLALAYLF